LIEVPLNLDMAAAKLAAYSSPLDPSSRYDADVCTLGLASKVALPSTAVRDSSALSAAPSSAALATASAALPPSLPSASSWDSTGEGGEAADGSSSLAPLVPGGSSGGKLGNPSKRGTGYFLPSASASKQLLARGKKWLLQRKKRSRDRWSNYRIGG
jgi:hypothetical protein